MVDDKRRYKSWELYTCLALNRLAQELNIDLYQANIEEHLDTIFAGGVEGIPKVEISYEIKSNHHMTNKILKKLEADELVSIIKFERTYKIAITKKGVLYLRRFNAYFIAMYNDMIKDHYRYKQVPGWFQEGGL